MHSQAGEAVQHDRNGARPNKILKYARNSYNDVTDYMATLIHGATFPFWYEGLQSYLSVASCVA